jgi:SAM-dependent methyltransferase
VKVLDRLFLPVWQYLNRKLKSASLRLTYLTGKSRVPMHPHHLLEERPDHHWYLRFLPKHGRLLDVGCANAQHAISAAGIADVVVGFDHDFKEVRRAATVMDSRSIANVALLIGDAEAPFPFESNAFDSVLFLDVIEHLHRRDECLREIHRVLRRNGTLLLSAPNEYTRWKERLRRAGLSHYSDPDHKIEYSQSSLRAELEKNGFAIASDFMPIVIDTPLAGLIDLTGGISLALYRRLSQWKVARARRQPQDSIGWRLICVKQEAGDEA